MIPRRLRRSTAPKPPMYVIESDEYVTREAADWIAERLRDAVQARRPSALFVGPGLRVKEIKR